MRYISQVFLHGKYNMIIPTTIEFLCPHNAKCILILNEKEDRNNDCEWKIVTDALYDDMFKAEYTARRRYNPVQYNTLLHTLLQWLRQNINHWELALAKDTPYLALRGKLWGAYCGDFAGN